jgi:hypothetical protein
LSEKKFFLHFFGDDILSNIVEKNAQIFFWPKWIFTKSIPVFDALAGKDFRALDHRPVSNL